MVLISINDFGIDAMVEVHRKAIGAALLGPAITAAILPPDSHVRMSAESASREKRSPTTGFAALKRLNRGGSVLKALSWSSLCVCVSFPSSSTISIVPPSGEALIHIEPF